MPVTPSQALSRSPAALMSDDERSNFERFKDRIDNMLSTEFIGGPVVIRTEPCTSRVIYYLARAYESAGWRVNANPLDGALGKAQDLVAAGAQVGWAFMLMPDWSRD